MQLLLACGSERPATSQPICLIRLYPSREIILSCNDNGPVMIVWHWDWAWHYTQYQPATTTTLANERTRWKKTCTIQSSKCAHTQKIRCIIFLFLLSKIEHDCTGCITGVHKWIYTLFTLIIRLFFYTCTVRACAHTNKWKKRRFIKKN